MLRDEIEKNLNNDSKKINRNEKNEDHNWNKNKWEENFYFFARPVWILMEEHRKKREKKNIPSSLNCCS
jgi:hypothetical protein